MNPKTFINFLLGPIFVVILSFISIPLMASLFSPETIGKFAVLQVLITFSIVFLSFGLDLSYIRSYHETVEKKLLLFKVLLPGGGLLILFILTCLLIDPVFIVNELFEVDSSAYFYVSALAVLSSFLIRFLSLPLRMENKGKSFSLVQSIPKAFLFVFLLISYHFGIEFGDFFWLLVAHSCSLLFALLINFLILGKPKFNFSSFDTPTTQYKKMFQFGVPAAFSGVIFWLFQSSDKLLLKMLSPLSDLGVYSVAFSIAAGVAVFSNVFNMLWSPYIYEKLSSNSELDDLDYFINFYLMFTYLFLGLVIACSPVITLFFSEQYNSIKYIIACCALGFLFYSLSEMTAIGINIEKKTFKGLIATVISAILGISISYFLVLYFSATGAAIGMLISYWIYLVLRTEVSIWVWKKVDRLKIYFVTLIALSFASIFAFLKLDEYKYTLVAVFIYYVIGFLIFRRTFKQTVKFIIKLKN